MTSTSAPETLVLPEGYDLHRRSDCFPFTLRHHGEVVSTAHGLRRPALEAEASPELRAFAAAMMAAAFGAWMRVDDDMEAIEGCFEVFGRYETANPRSNVGYPWYAHVVWVSWSTEPPHLVHARNGAPLRYEPSHYRLLVPPREAVSAMTAEAGAP